MPSLAAITPASNGNFGRGRPIAPGPIVNSGKAGSLFDNLDKVKVVRCDEVQFRFLGISLAGYNVADLAVDGRGRGLGHGEDGEALI